MVVSWVGVWWFGVWLSVAPRLYRGCMTDDDLPAGAVVVGTWQRRTAGRFETLRLVRSGSRWFVRRRAGGTVEVRELPNRALAYAAVAAVVGDAWTLHLPPARHGPRHLRAAAR